MFVVVVILGCLILIWLDRAERSVVLGEPSGCQCRCCVFLLFRVVTPPVSLHASVAQTAVVVGHLVCVLVVIR